MKAVWSSSEINWNIMFELIGNVLDVINVHSKHLYFTWFHK